MAADNLIRPETLLTAIAVLAAAMVIAWLRERRMLAQRAALRALNTLAEEVISAASAGEIVDRLTAALPGILGITGVRVLLYDRVGRSLNPLPPATGEARASIPLDAAGDTGPALAFRNRTLLAYPDLRRVPAPPGASGNEPVRAVMFVPMVRKGEVVGILEASHDVRPRGFSSDERAAAQHLANQVAAALGLLEQQSVREQVFRGEKLAASGELISGVASALRAPLAAIEDLGRRLMSMLPAGAAEAEVEGIVREACRATEIVDRLVSFSQADGEALRPIDLLELLQNLIEFREPEWITRGITLRNLLPDQTARVLGVEGPLEQVFLSLLVHAEQSVASQADKTVSVGAAVEEGRVVVEISYPSSGEPSVKDNGGTREETTLDLAVCRGVLRSCEGDIKFSIDGASSRFEVTLPLVAGEIPGEPPFPSAGAPVPALTLLLVEPDAGAGRRLLMLLAERDHRVVVAHSAEEAIGLVERFRFDGLLSAMHLPGTSWAELFERVRGRVRACVLLTNGYDAAPTRDAAEDAYLILSRPVAPDRLNHVLAAVAARAVVE